MNKNIKTGLRIILGLMMFVMGINKFLNFMPMPPLQGDAATLMGIYSSSGFLKLIGVLESLSGLGLLLNKFVPLSLTFLVAILFNAFLFHVFHNLAGIGAAAVGMILALVNVYAYKERFKDLLSA